MWKVAKDQALRGIKCVRPKVLQVLKEHWWRPGAYEYSGKPGEPLTEIAMIGDHTPILVNKSGWWDVQGEMWDAHHRCHAVKKHIAVQATYPYYARAASKWCKGSRHDAADLREISGMYVPLLHKKPADFTLFPGNPTWAVLLDSGYLGDHPGLHKVVLPKPTSGPAPYTEETVAAPKSKRVVAECFFGRMCVLWSCLLHSYQFKKAHLNADIDIMILLTNEHIRLHQLNLDKDYEMRQRFYGMLKKIADEREAKAAKKRDSTGEAASKRAKLSSSTAMSLHPLPINNNPLLADEYEDDGVEYLLSPEPESDTDTLDTDSGSEEESDTE